MWTIVIFLEENSVEVIPVSWLLSNNACYWPHPDKSQTITRIMSCVQPHESWQIYSIRFPNGKQQNYSEYLRARKACRTAEEHSDITTDNEFSSKRKTKKKIVSSSDDDEDASMSHINIPFPKIPGVENNKNAPRNAQKSIEKNVVFEKDASAKPSTTSIVSSIVSEQVNGNAANGIATSAKVSTTSIVSEKVIDLLLKLTSEVSKLSVKLDYLQQDITKLRQEIPENQVFEKKSKDEWQEMFPLKFVEDVAILEDLLEIKEKRSDLLEYIQLIGGFHLQEITQRSMNRVIDDDLAIQYSFAGKKGKLAFEKLKLGLVLQEGIIWNARKKTKDTTEKDVQKAIGDWLRHAKERKQRRDNKKENN